MRLAYHRPGRLEEALAIRAETDVTVLAGGTDVYPAKVARAGWGDMRHKDILDLSLLPELRGIRQEETHWRIGALTTWTDIVRADLPPLFHGLQRAAREVGGVQIQNRGTIAGNICTASPAGDGAPNLLALSAEIELASCSGRRLVPMAEFIDAYRHTACGADELVTSILIPNGNRATRGHFLKLGARKYLVISIVMAAGVIETDEQAKITSARLAIGACSAIPQRLCELEVDLVAQPLAMAADIVVPSHFEALTPIDDIRGSAAYRREAALVLVKDLLVQMVLGHERRAA